MMKAYSSRFISLTACAKDGKEGLFEGTSWCAALYYERREKGRRCKSVAVVAAVTGDVPLQATVLEYSGWEGQRAG